MTMALSHLQSAMQKLGLEEAIPDLSQASDAELQAPFAKFLFFAECHKDFGISENFNPNTLPLVPFSEVTWSNDLHDDKDDEDEDDDEGDDDGPSRLMKSYFNTNIVEELVYKLSQGPTGTRCPRFTPTLDSDHFLGCRLFFRDLAQAVQEGFRIVSAKCNEGTLPLLVHVKALRMLKALPNTAERESKETVLLQVEYYAMTEDEYKQSQDDYTRILMDLVTRYRRIMPPIIFSGSEEQIRFIHQVLQAHERLLEETFISEHDREWNPRQKCIRPSFIVPLTPISHDPSSTLEILHEIEGTVVRRCEGTRSNAVRTDKKDCCAVCGNANMKLKVCSVYKKVNYCTRKCQESDWKSHRKTCRAMDSESKCSRK